MSPKILLLASLWKHQPIALSLQFHIGFQYFEKSYENFWNFNDNLMEFNFNSQKDNLMLCHSLYIPSYVKIVGFLYALCEFDELQ